MSTALTEGIRVTVASGYVPNQSSPLSRRYVYAYKVRIQNDGPETVKLRARHWMITDAAGSVREVQGPGVVGEQPVLRPGEHFEYVSSCILETSCGKMEGTYDMELPDGRHFNARIAPFSLELPFHLN